MEVTHLDPRFLEIFRKIFRHLLRQRRHQNPFLRRTALSYLSHQIVDLPLQRTYFDDGIKKPRGADDLLHHLLRLAQFVLGGRGRNVDDLVDPLLKLLKCQGAVIKGRRQTKAVVHQGNFARPIPSVHRAKLGHSHMRLVHDDEEIFGEII